MPRFILDERDTRTVFELDQAQVRVGRAPENDIAVLDLRASREHCRVDRHDDQFVLVDLGSQNGTRLNGHLVERVPLKKGDEIGVGNARLFFDEAPPPDDPRSNQTMIATPAELGLGDERTDRLERLQRVAQALNSQLNLDPLLRIVMDHLVELTGAERGFLVLAEPDGKLRVRVARNFEQEDVQTPQASFSASIVDRVMKSGEMILTANAVEDARFAGTLSINAIRARSVLCLPFRVIDKNLGAVYVDNRLQMDAFKRENLELLTSFADLAGTAIERASLYEANQRHMRELEVLNQSLEDRVDNQARELDVVRERLRGAGETQGVYQKIIGRSKAMRDVLRMLDKIVATDEPVLITGDSGTGKELIAKAIHAHGPRSRLPFLSENCAALTDTLLESELFGHVRGSFTGADRDKKGLFELADKGTLFLDEVADMSPDMQKKLLRTLQEGEVRPVGGKRVRRVDVRIVSASNKRLDRLVRAGEFREDLFYRLRVLTLDLPPLRDRKDDIPLLVDHFLHGHAQREKRPPRRMVDGVLEILTGYDWPGNIRELENEVKRMVALSGDVITEADLSEHVRRGAKGLGSLDDGEVRNIIELVEQVERTEIEKALHVTQNNKTRAADLLGISRFTLQRKLDKYGMT